MFRSGTIPASDAKFLDISSDFGLNESVYVHEHSYNGMVRDVLHYHNFYELVVVRGGTGEHIVQDGNYRVAPGDAFLICPFSPHGYDNMESLELINLLYRPELLASDMAELKNMPGYSHFFEIDPQLTGNFRFRNRITLPPETVSRINELVMQIRLEQNFRKSGWQLMIKNIFIQILCLICRTFERENRQSYETYEITQILKFINEHYARKITLNSLSSRFGRSVPAMLRLFQSALNQSPIATLINVRLEKAAIKLYTTSEPIGIIAEQCGFADSNYFTKMFSAKYGMSPRAYRKKFEQEQNP